MFLLPVGVEGARLGRLPVVSIGIAVACALGFALTWLAPDDPERGGEPELVEMVEYWQAHPYLEVPEAFVRLHLPEDLAAGIVAMRDEEEGEASDRALEQAELDNLMRRVAEAADASPMRRFALVPARGAVQWGWLSHLFLHAGWLHLLGNLLFFYLTGPLLEDAWGRPFFLGFYLLGGLVAAVAQVSFDPQAAVVGASGAIAACIGAFTLRYARERVRLGYLFFAFLRVYRGTFLVPAWAWGLFWFGSELFDLWVEGGKSGVAVMAHLGGFAFGFAVAGGARALGRGQPLQDAAESAGDQESLDRQALDRDPSDVRALLSLARRELEAGKKDSGMARAERAVHLLMGKKDERGLFEALQELGPAFDCAALRPQVAANLGRALARAPASLCALREPALLRAADCPGEAGAQALLGLAELKLGRGDGPGALALLARARGIPGLGAAQRSAIEALAQRAAPGDGAPRPRILPCTLLGVSADALKLESEGRQATMEIGRIRAIHAALVQGGSPAGTSVLVTDLLLAARPEAVPTVARFDSSGLRLGALFPGVPPREAYPKLLAHLARRSCAPVSPELATISAGGLATYPTRAALDAAFYGAERGP